MDTAEKARIEPSSVESYEEHHGRGVIAQALPTAPSTSVAAAWLRELNPDVIEAGVTERSRRKSAGMSGVHVMRDMDATLVRCRA